MQVALFCVKYIRTLSVKFSPAPAVGPRMKYSTVHSFKIMFPRSLAVGALLFSLFVRQKGFRYKKLHSWNVIEVVLISGKVAWHTKQPGSQSPFPLLREN